MYYSRAILELGVSALKEPPNMKRPAMRIRPPMLCLLLICVTTWRAAAGKAYAQNVSDRTPAIQPAPLTGATPYSEAIANPSDTLRQKRSARYNSEPGTPPLDEDSYPALVTASTDPHELPDLPVRESDAIVVGTVAAQHAYFSSDRTAIYTEFKIHVEQLLKMPKDFPLHAGETVDLERQGGAVLFTTDITISRGFLNKSLPWPGKRYLFFLEYHAEEKDFSILTGYKLEGGVAAPLDRSYTGPGSNETVSLEKNALPALPPPLPDPRTEFVPGMTEAQILAKVKAALASVS